MVASLQDTTGETCVGANTCSADGVCKKKLGETCLATANECAAGSCMDGHCCPSRCAVCMACTGPGGTCVPVTNAEDSYTCKGTSTCDAKGFCKKKDGQVCVQPSECASGLCTGGVCGPPPPPLPPRCTGLAATCGPAGNEDCCASLFVPGGTFYRGYDGDGYTDKSYPATISGFYLDKYEVTVGRFRQFVNAGKGTRTTPPNAGGGAHPVISGSGWLSTWNGRLAASTAELKSRVKCNSTAPIWTDEVGSNESKPINCLDWYTAFAFCAWEGGRLPTEAEWNYAASGGDEQRVYPWSSPPTSTTFDDTYLTRGCISPCVQPNVGAKSPQGDARWGQADLAGGFFEWVLDGYGEPYLYPIPCNDCAELSGTLGRVFKGGPDKGTAKPGYRYYVFPEFPSEYVGVRCARNN